ncbi:MAG: hypothetical protein IIB68_03325 [Proteobacteria bacterium]|nr:hypothetical protein [Pseudomonadota bacterium]
MNTLRLSTLSLSLVVAVLTLGYANPSFAAPKKCDGALPGTPGCGGGNNTTGIEYTVELMGRVFDFDSPVDVTPNAKENALFPNPVSALTFSRPGEFACNSDSTNPTDKAVCAWDAVFASCENFFGPHPILYRADPDRGLRIHGPGWQLEDQ